MNQYPARSLLYTEASKKRKGDEHTEYVKLIERFQSGDAAAFAELFTMYRDQALRTAYMITDNYHDSENVVQDSFIKCYHKLSELKQPASFPAWFYRILTRTAWQYVKTRRREQPEANIFLHSEAALTDPALDRLTTAETQELLLQAIKNLNVKEKTVIVLYYYNEMSIDEIAVATASRPGTVKSRLFTARRRLQKLLQSQIKPQEALKHEF